MPMAETPFAQPGLLAVAVNCTGDTTVAPLVGLDTVTPAPVVDAVVKIAVTDVSAFSVTEQLVVVPQPPPLQLEKEYPLAAVAVRLSGVPAGKEAEHVPGQLIPAG